VPPVIAEVKNASANETSTAVISCKATGTPTPTVRIYRGTKLVENTKVSSHAGFIYPQASVEALQPFWLLFVRRILLIDQWATLWRTP